MKKAASIFLRADMEPVDIRFLSRWLKNRQVTRYLNENPNAPDELSNLVQSVPAPLLTCRLNQQGRFFLVCGEEAEQPIGFVKLREDGSGCYEIVFAIGEEELWGNGYGSKAVQAAQYQAFLEWRARKLVAKIYHGNTRSERTVRGCGFREERQLEKLSYYTMTQNEYFEYLEKKRA